MSKGNPQFGELTDSYQYDILISMNYVQTVSKIRERGQLTVPQSIRETLNWTGNQVMVKIVTTQDGFRVEKLPISHPQHPKKKLTKKQWDQIWKDFERISSSGRQDIKLTDFLRKDRDSHF